MIQYSGFNSNDFTISKSADDDKGILTVKVNLNKDYADKIGNGSNWFNNYSTSYTFTGFMTTTQYNQRFNVNFVDDSSDLLIDLKQMQVSQLHSSLTSSSGLTVGGKTYSNIKDLLENLLVKNQGSSIPIGWANNNSITATMFYDNSQGTASFTVTIPKSLMLGANSDLNLVVNYTGFVKGNIDTTNDNLSFIADNMLENYLISKNYITKEQFESFTPSEFAKWLENNSYENALKLITYKSGEYVTLLNSNKYKFTIVLNNSQRTVSVYINFEGLTNDKSLSEYLVTYTI